jgi:serine/threonine protein phosphatase PrpC
MLVIRHATLDDLGRLHQDNDDRWYADPKSGLYFVTDGMANQATPDFIVETLPSLIQEEITDWVADRAKTNLAGLLQSSLACLNERVRQQLDLRTSENLGATLVLALLRDGTAFLAHLGDSRIYLHRNGQLQQLTRDHSVVQNMVDCGMLTQARAAASRRNGGPTRFIGMPGVALADVRLLTLQAGDRLLLCSDGLTEMLDDEDMLAILNKSPVLQDACRHLVDAANVAGGYDNITVMLIAAD